jgi:Lon protease-like protein
MQLPLFPLNTVLFPDGVLPLRIFEARYMDMARDCLRDNSQFGVCLITKGSEVGGPASFEAVGCVARIESWDMPQLGLLNLRAIGVQRLRVLSTRVREDRLAIGEVELLEADVDSPPAPRHADCVQLLRRIIDDMQANAADDGGEGRLPFQPPWRLDSSTWVGNRLCEVLPVPLKAKQKLMELDDAGTRLDIVTDYLRQHAVLK